MHGIRSVNPMPIRGCATGGSSAPSRRGIVVPDNISRSRDIGRQTPADAQE
jgi:hypothetical protein